MYIELKYSNYLWHTYIYYYHCARKRGRYLGYLHFLRSDPRIPGLQSNESKAQTVFLLASKHEFQT